VEEGGLQSSSEAEKLASQLESKTNLDYSFDEGLRDETCIDESPEMRQKSRITNIMVEQNKKGGVKSNKF